MADKKYKGFLKEDEVTIVDTAYIDGYHFGDRLLEGVMFRVTVKDGDLSVEVIEQCKKYFSRLNQEMWLGAALAYAKDNDIFYETPKGGGEDLILVEA